jgi:predicted ArsR family transcriptional regulator
MGSYAYDDKFKKRLRQVVACVEVDAKTQQEMADEIGLSTTSIRVYLQYARDNRLIYISGYKPSSNGSKPIFLYRAGSQDDVPYERKVYVPKTKEKFVEYVVPQVARCDEAAAWMRNPIPKEDE